jgi:hypothetical protein
MHEEGGNGWRKRAAAIAHLRHAFQLSRVVEGPSLQSAETLHDIVQASCNKTPQDAEDCRRLHTIAQQDRNAGIPYRKHGRNEPKHQKRNRQRRPREVESLQYAIQHATYKQPAAWVVAANESPTSRSAAAAAVNTTY